MDQSLLVKTFDSYVEWSPIKSLRHYYEVYEESIQSINLSEKESEIKSFAHKCKINESFFMVKLKAFVNQYQKYH